MANASRLRNCCAPWSSATLAGPRIDSRRTCGAAPASVGSALRLDFLPGRQRRVRPIVRLVVIGIAHGRVDATSVERVVLGAGALFIPEHDLVELVAAEIEDVRHEVSRTSSIDRSRAGRGLPARVACGTDRALVAKGLWGVISVSLHGGIYPLKGGKESKVRCTAASSSNGRRRSMRRASAWRRFRSRSGLSPCAQWTRRPWRHISCSCHRGCPGAPNRT